MTSSKTLQKRPMQRQIFTVEEANATLPLVRAIMTDHVQLSREIVERRQRLALLMGGKSANDAQSAAQGSKSSPQRADPYHDELIQIEKEVERDRRQLREYEDELRAIGAEPKGGPEGLVDFPALIDGQKVFLCWKLDEPKVMYYHGLEDGFAGRQAIPSSSKALPNVGNEKLAFGSDAQAN